MFRFTGRVEYADGRIQEFRAGNAALAAWERYAMRHKYPLGEGAPGTMSALVIAHHALAIDVGVDAWMETVEGVELEADEDADTVNPTPSALSTG